MADELTARANGGRMVPVSGKGLRLWITHVGEAADVGSVRGRAGSRLSFRSVNRPGSAGYDSGLQRHHLLPRELLGQRCFGRMFTDLAGAEALFSDFRSNGLLLPGNDRSAMIMGLPMHRGPHRSYSSMVIERVGVIEERWASCRPDDPDRAGVEALFRLQLLQRTLRRRLLDPKGQRMALSRKDPALRAVDFSALDQMAELLWSEDSASQSEYGAERAESAERAA